MEKVVSISVKGMIVTKLQNALAGVTLWLYFPCPVPAVCPLPSRSFRGPPSLVSTAGFW